MKYFDKKEKTLIRRVTDKVMSDMTKNDCYTFIRGALKAELDLHFLPGELSINDNERVQRDNDNEFKSLVGNWNENELDRDNVYFELIFDEEDFRCYFIIEDRFTSRSK